MSTWMGYINGVLLEITVLRQKANKVVNRNKIEKLDVDSISRLISPFSNGGFFYCLSRAKNIQGRHT